MGQVTDKITFKESEADPKRAAPPRSLRDRLGPLSFAITLAAVVLAGLVLGTGISMLVKALRRPPIVTPTHGTLGQTVIAKINVF